MSAKKMVDGVLGMTTGWRYDVVSIGFPGRVLHGHIAEKPPSLGSGWIRFDFEKAFGCPVKILNDAAMQALGSYRGKTMLFLGLGTGLGSALVVHGIVHALELGDLPYRQNQRYVDYVGRRGLRRLGKKNWRRHVLRMVQELKTAI